MSNDVGEQILFPFLHERRDAAFEKTDKGVEGLSGVPGERVGGSPVGAVLTVVVGQNVLEAVSHGEFSAGAAGADVGVAEDVVGQGHPLPARTTEELSFHETRDE